MVYLVRHGRIQLPDEKQRYYIGHLDVPLSQAGMLQAQDLGQQLAGLKIAAIYCSDLARSRETARQIATHFPLEPVVRPDLREISMGSWEGLTFAQVAERYPQEFARRGAEIEYYHIAGGESFAECGERARAALADILNSTVGNVLIVGHAGLNRTLLCAILGMSIANAFNISQDYCCLNIICCDKHGYRIKMLNYSATFLNTK